MKKTPEQMLLQKIVDGLEVSREFTGYFNTNQKVEDLKNFKKSYFNSHFDTKDLVATPQALCFSLVEKPLGDRKGNLPESKEEFHPLWGAHIGAQKEKLSALLDAYGIKHTYAPMAGPLNSKDKRYHSELVVIEEQPDLLEKLTKLQKKKAQPALKEAESIEIANNRLNEAMSQFGDIAGFERTVESVPAQPLEIWQDNYVITAREHSNDSPSQALADKLGSLLIEAGLERVPQNPKSYASGQGTMHANVPDEGYNFGPLTKQQVIAATTKIESEIIKLTKHKSIGEYKGSLLTPEFDKECADRPESYALQTLLGMISNSTAIPLNAKRRLTSSIQGELTSRGIND